MNAESGMSIGATEREGFWWDLGVRRLHGSGLDSRKIPGLLLVYGKMNVETGLLMDRVPP